jgi:hypothetical protein
LRRTGIDNTNSHKDDDYLTVVRERDTWRVVWEDVVPIL